MKLTGSVLWGSSNFDLKTRKKGFGRHGERKNPDRFYYYYYFFFFLLCCWLPPKLGEMAKVYRYRIIIIITFQTANPNRQS